MIALFLALVSPGMMGDKESESWAPAGPARPARFAAPALLATALLFSGAATMAHAEVTVTGSFETVHVDARASSVGEVLAALTAAMNVKYRSSVELNRPVHGAFNGPLVKVLSRLLENFDYVMRRSGDDRIEVTVIKFAGDDSAKVISRSINSYSQPTGSVGNSRTTAAPAGGPYPDPLWRARSYSRTMQPR